MRWYQLQGKRWREPQNSVSSPSFSGLPGSAGLPSPGSPDHHRGARAGGTWPLSSRARGVWAVEHDAPVTKQPPKWSSGMNNAGAPGGGRWLPASLRRGAGQQDGVLHKGLVTTIRRDGCCVPDVSPLAAPLSTDPPGIPKPLMTPGSKSTPPASNAATAGLSCISGFR